MTTLDQIEDAQLIERLRENNLDALGVLFDRYYSQVYRTALVITRDNDIADDIAQDCFLRLHQYAHRIDTHLPLSPWLYRVTVNLAYTWLARRKRRRVSLEGLVDHLMTPPRSSPDHLAERADIHDRVHNAINRLPHNQRAVIVLHYLWSMSLEEIAELLDCPVGTIKSRLHYARKALRAQLENVDINNGLAHGYAGLFG